MRPGWRLAYPASASTEQERLSVRRGEGVFEPEFTAGIYRCVPESEPGKG